MLKDYSTSTMTSLVTAIKSHGDVVSEATETYGSGPLLLRIG